MHSDEKNIASIKEIHAEENISEFCNKYYHHLKNKEAVSKLFLKNVFQLLMKLFPKQRKTKFIFIGEHRRTIFCK
jgi:hypothetical protein